MPLAAVIFDLDGVIVDSEIWWHEERAAWAAARGLAWTEADTRALMGANTAGWARIMRERLGLVEADESAIGDSIVARVAERYAGGAPVIDGAVGTVRRIAARWPVAIASSAHRRVIDAALEATGLRETIAVVVSSDEVAHGKPAPDVYLEAARRLGVAPAACLVIEDSINGLRAGKAAGMTTILVPNASVPPAPGAEAIADLVLERLSDLDPVALRGQEIPRGGPARETT
ncbi:MAG: HAD family phosphatase [Chloroflexi bacterium]|nr:HAD family phosphatase [Chloroflexota bacterium]